MIIDSYIEAHKNLEKIILKKYQISSEVLDAFKKCPRHQFIKKKYSLNEIYDDFPLEIYRDEKFLSTISQPSFVLMMIDLLKIEKSNRVLEIGTGSGWNAAIMSHLCELVVTIEIIPKLANETAHNLSQLGYKNIFISEGDGSSGYSPLAPFDRGIFTAGATDLPRPFYQQIKKGGLLIFILQTGHVDQLLLLEKKENCFEELKRIPCNFVPFISKKINVSGTKFREIQKMTQFEGRFRLTLNQNNLGRDSIFEVI